MAVSQRVLVMENHDLVRTALVGLIDSLDGFEVGAECTTAAGAADDAVRCDVDIAVLDMHMPDGNGVQVCREIRTRSPRARCLLISSRDYDDARLAAVLAGASGYLLKTIRMDGFVDALERVAAGDTLFPADVLSRARQRGRTDLDERLAGVSTVERRLLTHLALASSDEQIAELTGMPAYAVSRIFDDLTLRLGLARRTELIMMAARARAETAPR